MPILNFLMALPAALANLWGDLLTWTMQALRDASVDVPAPVSIVFIVVAFLVTLTAIRTRNAAR